MANHSEHTSSLSCGEASDRLYKGGPFIHGLRDGIPIALGYFAVAFSLGIIAKRSGFTAIEGFISSIFMHASAGEYGLYTVAAAGAVYIEAIAISAITNLRYILMSAALTQKFSPQTSLLKRMLIAFCVTDEIFGISIAYPGYLAPAYTFGAATISILCWAAGTASGIIAGGALPANIVSALSVALYGMFIAIIVPPAKKNKVILISILASFMLSGLCAVLPYVSTWSNGTRTILLTIIISTIVALLRPIKDGEEDGSND